MILKKKIFDFFIIAIFLPIILLLIIVVSLIKLLRGEKVFYLCERVGLNNKVFTLYKFRTIYKNNSYKKKQFHTLKKNSFNYFLNKIQFDELPQFLNVLIGNMSIIGPRPERYILDKIYSKKIKNYNKRKLVKPGITGYAQINNTYSVNIPQTKNKLKYDLYYLNNQSIFLDLKIILISILRIFKNIFF